MLHLGKTKQKTVQFFFNKKGLLTHLICVSSIMFLGGSAYRNRTCDLTSEGPFSSFVVPKGMLLKLKADKSDFLPL